MWTICLENQQQPAPGKEHLQGDQEACLSWLSENQLFWNEENPNPDNGEVSGSKFVLLDLTDHLKTEAENKLKDEEFQNSNSLV